MFSVQPADMIPTTNNNLIMPTVQNKKETKKLLYESEEILNGAKETNIHNGLGWPNINR